MQLLLTFATPDYSAWKADFDARAEDRAAAGLGMMQLWRDADDPARTVGLFEVRDRTRAQEWLKQQQALGRDMAAQFVRTA